MTDITLSGRSAAAQAGDTAAVLGTGIMGSAMARNLGDEAGRTRQTAPPAPAARP